ncbi:hypothetical protein DEIGR_101058 [Deinococcus grandis]|uniref:Uncharacterized protein n=1 Tax=Deinococcus grandis TaxID=57498 RepID=A0A124BRF6_9DEIO|nr:hypothetical protein [Deinococcus grandis]BBN95480.1 hypothetical protein DEGR_22130 [Deinococcus grandis]GAQ21031.1 hypothetical protein DEIGR_101058 [Deinococcus grandis]
MTPDPHAALMTEGDRLARQLTQTLHVTAHDPPRLTLLGRSLALNLTRAFQQTIEHVTRHAGHPVHAQLTCDAHGHATLHLTRAGPSSRDLPAADLLRDLLWPHGTLHPAIREHLQDALSGSEHHATRALVAALRHPSVLKGMEAKIRAALPRP